jgi:hypothetical protein
MPENDKVKKKGQIDRLEEKIAAVLTAFTSFGQFNIFGENICSNRGGVQVQGKTLTSFGQFNIFGENICSNRGGAKVQGKTG